MHVFVTGATGFIGYHTVLALVKAGHSVRLGVRNLDKMRALYAGSGVDISDYAVGEITDKGAIESALVGCDGVVHTAAMVSLDANKAEIMYHTNVTGTRLVIGGAVAQGIRSIVHVSSAAALYDPYAPVLDESLPLADQSTPYGKSKADSDNYVRGLIESGAKVAITYPSGVLGPDDPAMSEGNQGLAIFFNHCFVNTSSGMQIIDVRELANVHRLLLEQQLSGSYIVSGHYRSWVELRALIEAVTGRRLRCIKAPGALIRLLGLGVDQVGRWVPLDVPFTSEAAAYATQWVYADDRKLRRTLGLEYRPLDDTLRDTIRWLADAGHIDPWWAAELDEPATPTQSSSR